MTVEGERFITEMPKAIRGDIAGLDRRLVTVELRQTAMEQVQQGMMTQLVAMQHSLDGLTSDMRRVKQRLELVDGNDAR